MKKRNKFVAYVLSTALLATGTWGLPGIESKAASVKSDESDSYEVISATPLDADMEVQVAINDANFPDANFRKQVLSGYDLNHDGYLSGAEINVVHEIYIDSYDEVHDMTGVEYFTELVDLSCRSNSIEKLDVSKNIKLKSLDCGWNLIAQLDVSKCPELESLVCTANKLTSLDLSACPKLKTLDCYYNNLNSIDFRNNKALENVNVSCNYISTLDVSMCSQLYSLNCDDNKLTKMDLGNNALLQYFSCCGNQLTELDMSKNLVLKELNCERNRISSINISKNGNLDYFYCGDNALAFVNIENNPKINSFGCDNNIYYTATRTIDLSKITGFEMKKMSMLSGGTLNGTVLTMNPQSEVLSYTYDCGNGYSEIFQMKYLELPEAVEIYEVYVSDIDISIFWLGLENADSYIVYRKTPTTDWKAIRETYENGFTDDTAIGGVPYTYTVRAVNRIGKGDYDKKGVTATIKAIPGKVQLKSATATTTAIKVEWEKTPTAGSYIVYRHAKGENWKAIGTSTTTSYTDKTAIGGKNYAYTVKAVNENGNSASYDRSGVITKITAKPGKVTLLAPTVGKTAIKVNWKATPTASSYIIYRHAKGESWTKIGTSKTTSYVDATAVGGKNYAYTVKAVNGNGNSTSYDTTGVIAKITALPGITTMVGATAYTGYINVQWKATATASSYAVYRRTAGGKFAKIGTSTTTAYNDKTAVKGTTYYYTVIAVNGNGSCKTYDTTGVKATAK